MVELAVVGQFVQYWFPTIPAWVSAAVFMVLITAANMLGVKAFGEFEFWFAIIKIVAVIAMIIVGIAVILWLFQALMVLFLVYIILQQFFPNGFFTASRGRFEAWQVLGWSYLLRRTDGFGRGYVQLWRH